jgi:hypothetical protein
MEWLLPSAPEADKERCIKYLRFWLNSIVLHTYDTSTQVNDKCAPVVLIGTHADIVSSPADHEKISHVLEQNFGSSLAWPFKIANHDGEGGRGRTILSFFPVDNKKGRDNDPKFQYMMRLIEERMEAAAYTHKNVPLNWLKTMDAFKKTNKSFLTLTEVKSIAVSCGVKHDHVEALLRLLHEMGHLLWNEEPNLREVVILDAIEYLVGPATLVVCNHKGTAGDDLTKHSQPQHIAAAKNHPDEWDQLTNNGALKKLILSTLWADCADETKHLLTLMKKFGLLVPIDLQDSDSQLVEQFVVPALLPPAPAGQLRSRQDWGDGRSSTCSCYIVFTLKSGMKTETSINIDDLKTKGFMPSGLYERVVGGCLSWSQAVSENGYIRLEEVAMFSDRAVLSFGSQTFRIVPLPELNCMRLDIEGANPLPVMSRVLTIAEEAITECMKSLLVFVALPWQDKSNPSDVSFEDSDSSAAMLLPLENLRNATANKHPLKTGGRNLLSFEELTTDYRHWMNIYEERDSYDIFLSYRWGPFDSNISQQAFDACSNHTLGLKQRRVEVFLDIKRLQKGEAFDSAFAKALINSTVAIPLMSASALQGLTKQDGTWCDNVLLEWMIAAECMKANGVHTLVKKCYPILIGNITDSTVDTDVVIGDFFASGMLNQMPTCIPTETIKKAKRLLLENNMTPSPALDTYTVASFINEFKSLLGYKVECKARQLPSKIAADAHDMVARHLVEDIVAEPQAAASPTTRTPAAQDGDSPLDDLYALLMNPKRSKDQFLALQAYLQDDRGVTSAEDLKDYVKNDSTMNEIRDFLIKGGKNLFDDALKKLTA